MSDNKEVPRYQSGLVGELAFASGLGYTVVENRETGDVDVSWREVLPTEVGA